MNKAIIWLMLLAGSVAYCGSPGMHAGGPLGTSGGWDNANSIFRFLQVDELGRLPGLTMQPAAASPLVGIGAPKGSIGGWDDTNSTFRYLQVDALGRMLMATQETLAVGTIEMTATTAPTSPAEGFIYYDAAAHDYYGYTDSGWESFVQATTSSVSLNSLEVASWATINEDGGALGDFRWESDNNEYGIFGDASEDGVSFFGPYGSNASVEINGSFWVTCETTLNGSGGDCDTIIQSENNANMFNVDASGDCIGIGGAANTAYTLEVTGGWIHLDDHVFIDGEITQDAGNVVFNESGADYDFRIEGAVGAENAFFVQGSDGYVGIGTATPGYSLEVNGDCAISGTLEVHGITAEAASRLYMNIADNNANAFKIKQGNINYFCLDTTNGSETINIGCLGNAQLATWSATEIAFNDLGIDADTRIQSDNDANIFYIDASADGIGIGTNTPSYTLEVNGPVGFNSSAYVTGVVSAAGYTNRTRLYAWDQAGGIAVPDDSWVDLTWDTVVDASGYTLAGGGSDITIAATGTYEVNYQVNIWSDTTETRGSFKFRCYNITNTAEEAESIAYQWLRAPSGEATVNCTFREGFTAANQIKIQVQRQYGDLTNAETLAGSRLFIERIE